MKSSKNLFNSACRLLGIFNMSKKEWDSLKKTSVEITEDFILKQIEERSEAKKIGNFKLADEIRNILLNKGIILEDEKAKTKWKYK